MTDFRDPKNRDPNAPVYRDPMASNPPNMGPDNPPWSMATWGWIGGIAVVLLIIVVMFSSGNSIRTATDTANPPATIGQRTAPPAPTIAPSTDAPTMNRLAPAPEPVAPPAPPAQQP